MHVQVWSEKGTVRGILMPILEEYGVEFSVMHGFGSATTIHDAAVLTATHESKYKSQIIYVGDYDPSGLYMSEIDAPRRIDKYGGQAQMDRIAIMPNDGERLGLPSFPVYDKKKDPRYKWWTCEGKGKHCWEIDAMDPRMLRDRVEKTIRSHLDLEAWERCKTTEKVERESMTAFLGTYPGAGSISDPVSK